MPLSEMILIINQKVKAKGIQLADTRSVLSKEIYFMPKNVSSYLEIFLSSLLINKNKFESFEIDFDAKASEIDPW
jgi:hypothetical protein